MKNLKLNLKLGLEKYSRLDVSLKQKFINKKLKD